MKELLLDRIVSPIGEIWLVVDGNRLCSLDFGDYLPRMMKLLEKRYGAVQLNPEDNPRGYSELVCRYFAGEYDCLKSIPVSTGGTPFQQQVWLALRTIPAGQTLTYGRLAAQLGRPSASRAVGATNALNPISIVLPCHRIIGADFSLTGYAGGLERKRWLLEHESQSVAKN